MAVVRINKTKDYTVMSNFHLKEREMSLKAKGLLSVMLSLPDNWDYSIEGLVAICKENHTAIKSSLAELKKFGYLVIKKCNPNETGTGRYEYIYDIFERPIKKQEVEKQGVENQPLEIQPLEILSLENPRQLNTKELSTKESNTKQVNTKDISKKERKKSFDELIETYTDNDELKEELKNHLATRKAKKATLTNRAIELSFKKLDQLVYKVPINQQDEVKVKIVQQSIENGWVGFFELRESNYTATKNNKQQSGNMFFDLLREEGKME